MREHKSNHWITITGLVVVAAVIITGIIILEKPLLSYKSDMQESLKDLNNKDAMFYPWQLNDVLNNKMQNVVLFDIRNDYDFSHGHIPGAENIQAEDLSDKSFFKRMKNLKEKNTTVVLYGNDQLQANGPWMLFRQVGFSNVKVLAGGYQYYVQHKDDLAASKTDSSFMEGIPRYNFAKMAAPKNGAVMNTSIEKKPVQIQRRKKTTVVSGGC
jgi:3-mercaptopyruvate sulfurtransferase SseA